MRPFFAVILTVLLGGAAAADAGMPQALRPCRWPTRQRLLLHAGPSPRGRAEDRRGDRRAQEGDCARARLGRGARRAGGACTRGRIAPGRRSTPQRLRSSAIPRTAKPTGSSAPSTRRWASSVSRSAPATIRRSIRREGDCGAREKPARSGLRYQYRADARPALPWRTRTTTRRLPALRRVVDDQPGYPEAAMLPCRRAGRCGSARGRDPDARNGAGGQSDVLPRATFAWRNCTSRQRRFADAAAAYAWPQTANPRVDVSSRHAAALLNAGKAAEARDILQAALQKKTAPDASLLYMLAQAQRLLKEPDAAAATVQKLKAAFPQDARGLYLGRAAASTIPAGFRKRSRRSRIYSNGPRTTRRWCTSTPASSRRRADRRGGTRVARCARQATRSTPTR